MVTIYSQNGFQAFHLFESPAFNGDGSHTASNADQDGWLKVSASDTLYPGENKKFLKQKLGKVATLIKQNKAKWGEDVHVSLLMPQGRQARWRYDESKIYDWEKVMTKARKVNKNAPHGRFITNRPAVNPPADASQEIINQIKAATGVNVDTISYKVNPAGSTWAVQYSPDENGKRQVQIWVDGKPQLGDNGFSWAKPAAGASS